MVGSADYGRWQAAAIQEVPDYAGDAQTTGGLSAAGQAIDSHAADIAPSIVFFDKN